ncbi:MAG: HpcH/HpaI aldolase [Clostridia bacterium]|jgi:2-dehydro-3-deoxyglucarate aldolase/4-hydroxy-2-oxoheptanedioate aldolase|nr:HpcH/HpaI aldolase [Clostridia bacterium]
MNNVDKIKNKIAQGKLVKGFFLSMADTMVSEIAGFVGYDYVWIDAEHGPLDRQEIFHHIMTAQGAGCCAFVRVPEANPAMMKAILDMGPDGIIFPFVNNKEIAECAVKSCAYPIDGGIRGQGPIRAIKYGLEDEGEYLANAYQKVYKVMQIETMEGYENLDEIMAVGGIDSIFIGAADLARSIADPSPAGKAKLDQVYDDICTRVRDKGLSLGAAIGPSAEDAQRVTGKGVQWVVFGQDSKVLALGLKANLEALKDF